MLLNFVNLILVVIATCNVASSNTLQKSFSAIEFSALENLFNTLNGEKWRWPEVAALGAKWDFSGNAKWANPCVSHWAYLTCTDDKAHISEISFDNVGLDGKLPDTIVAFQNLTKLSIISNPLLFGPIPEVIGDLTYLQTITLSGNSISGSLPLQLFTLSNLRILSLQDNNMKGHIPPEIGYLHLLEIFQTSGNSFSGTLPDNYTSLLHLQIFAFADFSDARTLVATIPASIGNLRNLTILEYTHMKLEGTIPEAICNLTNLIYLYIQSTVVRGTIPDCIGNLQKLINIHIYNNKLSGTIPSSIGQLTKARAILLQDNNLHGTIPASIGNLQQLVQLDLYSNALKGTVPDCFATMDHLVYLNLNNNELTGTLVKSMFVAKSLIGLALQNNHFVGKIPDILCQTQSKLAYLILAENQLTGSIPPSIQNCNNSLQNLNLGANLLEGTVGSLFSSMWKIYSLLLYGNKFTGPIDTLLNPNPQAQSFLHNIDITNNKFSGSIPGILFQFPKIQTVAIGGNCFVGRLPSSICQSSKTLEVTILDGLGSECRQSTIEGNIPDCFWTDFTSMTTLHVGGNGLQGSFPHNLTHLSPRLVNLSVSHNRLEGTIPQSIQHRAWTSIDLGFNRFNGVLSSCNDSTEGLILSSNRISGTVPSSCLPLTAIDILDGNLFTCANIMTKEISNDHSSLPKHDESCTHISCGSNTIDIILIVTTVLSLLCLFTIAIKSAYSTTIQDFLWQMILELTCGGVTVDDTGNRDLQIFLKNVKQWVVLVTIFIGILTSITYLPSAYYFSTHTDTYRWFYSAAFKTGSFVGWLLCALEILLCACIYLLDFSPLHVHRLLIEKENSEQCQVYFHRHKSWCDLNWLKKVTIPKFLKTFVFVLVGVGIGAAIYGFVVWIQQSISFSFVWVALILVVVTVVKIGWIIGLYESAAWWFNDKSHEEILPTTTTTNHDDEQTATPLLAATTDIATTTPQCAARSTPPPAQHNSINILVTAIIVTTTIFVPCLVMLALSTNCFFYAWWEPPPPFYSTYEVEQCAVFIIDSQQTGIEKCEDSIAVHRLTINAPFTYSYQCSSTMLQYFTPIFFYRYLFRGIGIPMLHLVLKKLQLVLYPYREGTCCGCFYELVLKGIPSALQPSQGITMSPLQKKGYPFTQQMMIGIVLDISILLSFGVSFPFLAIVGCIMMCLHIVYVQYVYTRLVNLSLDAQIQHNEESLSESIKEILRMNKEDCKGLDIILVRNLHRFAVLIPLVWMAILYDTMGYDEVLGAVGVFLTCTVIIPLGWKYSREIRDFLYSLINNNGQNRYDRIVQSNSERPSNNSNDVIL